MKQLIICSIFSFLFIACDGVKKPSALDTIPDVIEKEEVESSTNLSSQGIPVTIPGVSKTEKGTKYIQLNSHLEDGLTIEVSMWDTENVFSIAEMVSEDKKIMSEEDGFEVLKEEANGYIFKLTYDGLEDYGFYYAINKNDRIIEFGPTINANKFYTFEETNKMFEACKKAY